MFLCFSLNQKELDVGNVAMETSFLEKIGPKIRKSISTKHLYTNSGGAWEVALKLLAKVEKGGNGIY